MAFYRVYTERLNPHVGESYRSVLRRARALIAAPQRTAPDKRAARHRFYRAMLWEHFQARRLVASLGGL